MTLSGKRTTAVCLGALVVAAAMFFVGRAGGSKEKTVHVRSKQEGRSVVVVAQKSPRVATISGRQSLAALVSPPRQQSSSSSSGSSGSSGSSSSGSSGSGSSGSTGTIIGGG
jgi:uncharacterized membrane protein YgcG